MEGHVRFLETHLVEKLKEKIFTSLEELNAETQKIVAALNSRKFQGKSFSRTQVDQSIANILTAGLLGD